MFRLLLFGLLFFVFIYDIHLVRIKDIWVSPPNRIGETVTLNCSYNLQDDQLYSVKWYKDEQEFFRFTYDNNDTLTFPVTGVKLHSFNICNIEQCVITLVNVTLQSQGLFTCEVSTERPTFKVYDAAIQLRIIDSINISLSKTVFSEGEDVLLNCTAPAENPAPEVRWVSDDQHLFSAIKLKTFDMHYKDSDLIRRSVSLEFQTKRDFFQNDVLTLRCVVRGQFPSQKMITLKFQKEQQISNKGMITRNFQFFCWLLIIYVTFINK